MNSMSFQIKSVNMSASSAGFVPKPPVVLASDEEIQKSRDYLKMKSESMEQPLPFDKLRMKSGSILWSEAWQTCYLELGFTRQFFEFMLNFLNYSFSEYTRDKSIIEKYLARDAEISEAALKKGIKKWINDA